MTASIAVSIGTPERKQEAKRLAASLHIHFLDSPESEEALKYSYLLIFMPSYLGLHSTKDKKLTPFYLDFSSGKMLYRSQKASLKKESLARAIGFSPRENPKIIDATAGLGRDSFILATLGFEVRMIERSPILHALLQDALNRANQDPVLSDIVKRLHLIHADANEYLSTLKDTDRPEVIYLDPMFPERKKSASVKKEMVILQNLLGKEEDAEILFNSAITCATRRVVVKRPRLAPTIVEKAPNFTLTGKSSRFDIYLV